MTFGCFARRTWWHCASFLVLRQIGNLRASCELRHLPLFMYALVLPRVLLGAECALRCVRPCAHIPYRRYDYRYPIPIIIKKALTESRSRSLEKLLAISVCVERQTHESSQNPSDADGDPRRDFSRAQHLRDGDASASLSPCVYSPDGDLTSYLLFLEDTRHAHGHSVHRENVHAHAIPHGSLSHLSCLDLASRARQNTQSTHGHDR